MSLFLFIACMSNNELAPTDGLVMDISTKKAPEGSLVFELVPEDNMAVIELWYSMTPDTWEYVSWEDNQDDDNVFDFAILNVPDTGSFSFIGEQTNYEGTPLCYGTSDGGRAYPVGDIYVTILKDFTDVFLNVDADEDSCVTTHTWSPYVL